ncbi:hypothetical protein CI109_105606 [Kwoniella shandongensis]|uniref:N-glycosylation protein EOS1 n=1 Tax=Kwoniella shandongensis TaxID=1734106 RepID=A0AAJ8MXI9_9TREE
MTAPPLSPRHEQMILHSHPHSPPSSAPTSLFSRSVPQHSHPRPGMGGGRTRSSTITSAARNGFHDGGSEAFASRSAPTSPSGRILMTPLSKISPIQLEQPSQTHLSSIPRQLLPTTVNANGNGGGSVHDASSSSTNTSVNGVRLPPAQPIHSHSLPVGSVMPRVPPPSQSSGITSSARLYYPSSTSSSSSSSKPIDMNAPQRIRQQPPSAFPPRTRTNDVRQLLRHNGTVGVGGGPPSETGLSDDSIDSDSTVRPGRNRHKQSLSQPDLQVLRSKRVEGWADGVMKGHPHVQGQSQKQPTPPTTRRPSLGRTKTPPSRVGSIPTPTTEQWLPASPKTSRSHPSLTGLRKSPSPRSTALSIPLMSPINSSSSNNVLSSSSSSEGSSPRIYYRPISSTNPHAGVGGMSSEDADDDYESNDSPSSGSLTFSPKRTRSSTTGGLRQRYPLDKTRSFNTTTSSSSLGSPPSGLGLSFGPSSGLETEQELTPTTETVTLPLAHLERMIRQSSLLSLRLLAIVPAVWGIAVLLQALVTGRLWVDVWPYGVDLSKEALERLVQGGVMVEGEWMRVSRGDMVLCIAWAICTGHFCFRLTTGLTHRWRSYYPLPSTITRLVSLQCLCWPATYLTLWFLGAERPLLAWIVIGVTTGWSRTVQMWVTSNVVPSSTSTSTFESGGSGTGGTVGGGGDTTPNGGGGNSRKTSNVNVGTTGPPITPEGLTAWEEFTYGRKWDWDAIAREVGWKVGSLLLVTTAWLFWGIESGRVVRA